MKSGFDVVRRSWLGALAAFMSVFPWTVRAEFSLGIGDIVEISVAGIPEMKTRVMVDLDGKITIPIIGDVPAAGLPISALRGRLQEEFSKRAISVRGADGRTMVTPVSPEEVSVSIAEYRPVYLSGDLAKVGEVAYRPGLTVRQAIVIAGGYDVVRYRINNPYMEVIDFNAEQAGLLSELAQEEEKKRQLQAELGYEVDDSEEKASVPEAAEKSSSASVIADQFRAQREDFEREVAHLRETAKRLAVRASYLNEQKAREDEGMKADVEDFEKAKVLLQQGSASLQQVADARRAMFLSTTRALQAGAEAAQAAMARDDISRAVQKLYDQRRMRLLNDLQESRSNVIKIEARLNALKEKLILAGSMKSIWAKGTVLKPEILVHRNINGRHEQLAGSETTPLLPGDVVEIALHAQ